MKNDDFDGFDFGVVDGFLKMGYGQRAGKQSAAEDETDIFGNPIDDYDPYEVAEERAEKEWEAERQTQEQEREHRAFASVPKHGIHAPAYKSELNNMEMERLRKAGKSLREIAEIYGCSPSTVRRRLNKLSGG